MKEKQINRINYVYNTHNNIEQGEQINVKCLDSL